jgi:threonylcarbamoyladenosine tRNA methylthiotransferase MtaB
LAASTDKICKHFHIPLQSGSPAVLKLMQRRYTTQFYSDLIRKINVLLPDAGIGVDVIVGFPGETDEEFKITHEFLRSLPVSYLHVFTYSERPDTKAILLSGSVDVFERKERNRILRILSEKKRTAFYAAQIGKELDLVFEKENDNGMMKGFSSNYVRIHAPYNESLVNKVTKVKITEAAATYCYTDLNHKHVLSEVI